MVFMLEKVLIANRGEIAVRILKACDKMGIPAVTVHSDADKDALHVKLSKESYNIGPPPVAQSYLNMDRIIEVAKESGATAIHPGYGLLAENHVLARKCRDNGIIFIGPPAEAIESMGLKVKARELMKRAGVPVVPGGETELNDCGALKTAAREMGYPVMIKASAGGGGIGMQIVKNDEELENAFNACQTRAKSYFGNASLYIEKYLENARHVEIQILADNHGNIIHLNERECSIQRRHQKVIEETPCVIVDETMRQEMGEVAKRAAAAIDYTNAGTVEFLVDKNKNFYFLEMNTRLQVEHPVTELTTGIDIVEQQMKIAAGETLEIKQEDVKINGHSIECRIYAEDPDTFFPSPGHIDMLRLPMGDNVRVDAGVSAGYTVSPYYDPLIAKLITWGEDRNKAIEKMKVSLSNFKIEGLKNNIPLHLRVLESKEFLEGNIDTSFVEDRLVKK